MSKIKKILKIKPRLDKDVLKAFIKYREKYTPQDYNQMELLEAILKGDINNGVDITTRSNGKSTNYIGMLGKLAIDFKFQLGIVIDHPYQWESMIESLKDSARHYEWTDNPEEDFWSYNLKTAIKFGVGTHELGVIMSVNKPADIKKMYATVCNCKFIIYDEFIRSDESYYNKEDVYFKEIKETCDKKASIKEIADLFPDNKSKVLLLGNPKNLNNPILSSMGVIKILEETETKDLMIKGKTGVRLDSNAKTNEQYIDTEFMPYLETETIDNLFKINKHGIVSSDKVIDMLRNPNHVSAKIKLDEDSSLEIINLDKTYVLSFTRDTSNCTYTLDLSYKSDDMYYLDDDLFIDVGYMDRFYKQSFIKFDTNFTRQQVLNSNLIGLNIFRVIALEKSKNKSSKEVNINEYQKTSQKIRLQQLYQNIFKTF